MKSTYPVQLAETRTDCLSFQVGCPFACTRTHFLTIQILPIHWLPRYLHHLLDIFALTVSCIFLPSIRSCSIICFPPWVRTILCASGHYSSYGDLMNISYMKLSNQPKNYFAEMKLCSQVSVSRPCIRREVVSISGGCSLANVSSCFSLTHLFEHSGRSAFRYSRQH